MSRDTDEMNLTAYALGELEGAGRQAVEARVSASADDRRFVDEVRAAADAISQELARGQPSGLEAIHYAAIELRLRNTETPRPARREGMGGRWGLALSLAASIAIVGGAVAVILLALPSRPHVAVNEPVTQPAERPILIPLVQGSEEPNSSSPGPGFAPDGKTPFVSVADHPVSSFSMDPDTTSYEEVRQALFAGRMPTRDSVKIEGLINAFTYDDPAPTPGAVFGARIEVGQCPWQPEHRLATIAIKARAGNGIVAEDAQTEVAFSPAAVTSYRLLGYEGVAQRDASAATPRAAERIAGGHAITALYEIITANHASAARDLLTLSVQYRSAEGEPQQVAQFVGRDARPAPGMESADFRFAAAVAEFGMALRDSSHNSKARLADAIALAQSGVGIDSSGQRRAFIHLARQAEKLMG
jgi:anti-sigma factor RsiW